MKKNAVLISLLIGLIACSAADKRQYHRSIDLKGMEKDCAEELGIHGDKKTDEQFSCQMKCVLEKLGHMKNGVFDPYKAAKDWKEVPELDETETFSLEAFISCKDQNGANDCDRAVKFMDCVHRFGKS